MPLYISINSASAIVVVGASVVGAKVVGAAVVGAAVVGAAVVGATVVGAYVVVVPLQASNNKPKLNANSKTNIFFILIFSSFYF